MADQAAEGVAVEARGLLHEDVFDLGHGVGVDLARPSDVVGVRRGHLAGEPRTGDSAQLAHRSAGANHARRFGDAHLEVMAQPRARSGCPVGRVILGGIEAGYVMSHHGLEPVDLSGELDEVSGVDGLVLTGALGEAVNRGRQWRQPIPRPLLHVGSVSNRCSSHK
jgi:hypothetical protein